MASSATAVSDRMSVVVVVAACTSVLALLWFLHLFVRRRQPFLSPEVFKAAPLIEKETVTHNTNRYRFAIGDGKTLGLPVGQHISFKYEDCNGKVVMRPYTPTSGDSVLGHVDFVIKTYADGNMSQHVDHLRIGDSILMRGPKGRFQYARGMKRAFGMVAGGTGITPMYQVLRQIAADPQDTTHVHLLFGNISLEDILLRSELDKLTRQRPGQIAVTYVLDKAPAGWQGEVGYVTADMLRRHCPAPARDVMLLLCGPRPMTKAVAAAAEEVGYAADDVFTF